MKSLGNIKLSVLNDSFDIQFEYATPQKIDFFAMTLMEIIKHKNNFPKQTFEAILLKLDIPKDLHNIFIERLEELMPKFDGTPAPDMNNAYISVNIDVIPVHLEEIFFNATEISDFSLTDIGEGAYNSKEIAESPEKWSGEYVYEAATGRLNNVKGKQINKQDDKDAIVVDMRILPENEVSDKIDSIIKGDLKKYVPYSNNKTKIFNFSSTLSAPIGLRDDITVSADNGKIVFSNKNNKIFKAFKSALPEEKNKIKEKMFYYPDIPQTPVDLNKAALARKRNNPISMKIAFGNRKAIELLTESKLKYMIPDNSDITNPFLFAGITSDGRQLVYNYSEITAEGYLLPLEEFDYSFKRYNEAFESFYNIWKTFKNRNNYLNLLIMASPKEQKQEIVRKIITEEENGIYMALDNARIILNISAEDKALADTVKNCILILAEKLLTMSDELKKPISDVINIQKEFKLPKDRIIKMIHEHAPKTDEIINSLLEIDENTTIHVYELVKLYNSLLKTGKLNTISHNNNLYANFLNYDEQYKKLKKYGFENYYKYSTPKDWDSFMKEVYKLKAMLEKIRQKLDGDIVKQATDFFTRVEDDYNEYTPFDGKSLKGLSEISDIQTAINTKQFDAQQIAFAIRSKYEDVLRTREKGKDQNANGDRKGIALIRFTIEPKEVDTVHKNWTNLNKLVHKATNMEHPLWKGNDEGRKNALIAAINYYKNKLIPKEDKK